MTRGRAEATGFGAHATRGNSGLTDTASFRRFDAWARASAAGDSVLIGRPRARGASHLLRLVLACLGVTLVVGCVHAFEETIPPDVQPFSPTVMGIIARSDGPTGTLHESYTLVGGGRIEFTPTTRTVTAARAASGDRMAAGTDGTGPWVAFAEHVAGSTPDCFRADGIVLDDGDAVVFGGYRFRKAPTFTTSFPST